MNRTDSQLKGVKGWLLLLCINLAILDPSSIVFNLFFVVNVSKPYFDKQPALLKLTLINGTCSIALAVFSVYAGMSLWKMLPGAVNTTKRYFRAVFFYAIFVVFLPLMVAPSEKTDQSIPGITLLNSIVTMSYAAAWYLYLKKSKRVENTYTADQDKA